MKSVWVANWLMCAISAIIAVTLLSPSFGAAQAGKLKLPGGGSIAINAKSASRDYDRGIIELTGNVQVVYGLQYISCDHALIFVNTQELEVEGNLVISSPMAYVEGNRAHLNYKDNTGIIYDGFVKSGQVVLEGRVLHKTGTDTYDADDAYFTACTTCPTAWTFEGSKISAELGGYARIKNPIMRVGGLRVLWLPYLILPLKSSRQTGLLIPGFDYSSKGGAALSLSGFWAISRSQDLTLTETFFTKRGIRSLGSYRYMLSATSYGELNAGFLRDNAFAADLAKQFVPSQTPSDPPQLNPNYAPPQSNRWFANYDHVFELPSNVTQRTHLTFVSDLRYGRDFPDEVGNQGDPAFDNRISLWRNTEDTHTSLDVNYYINQTVNYQNNNSVQNPGTSQNGAVHRFPALNYSLVDREIGKSGFLFNLKTDYVNFARDGFAWDDVHLVPNASTLAGYTPQLDTARTVSGTPTTGTGGVFDPTVDILRTGQRIDIAPEVSYPYRLGRYIDLLPALRFRHTQYVFNAEAPLGQSFDSTPFRDYLRTQISARTSFSRIYGGGEIEKENQSSVRNISAPTGWSDQESSGVAPILKPNRPTMYKHEIQPEVIYTGVNVLKQSEDTAFFGRKSQSIFLATQPPSDSDFSALRGFQLDYYDRLNDRNALSFALENKIIRKRWSGETSDYKQIARVRLAQTYDFDEARRAGVGVRTFPYSDISALLDIRLDHFETNTLLQYFPYHRVTNTSSRVKFITAHGNFFEINYTQTYLITEDVSDAFRVDPNTQLPTRTDDLAFFVGYDSKYLSLVGGVDVAPNYVVVRATGNVRETKIKGWTALLSVKPPGNCWGIFAGIQQSVTEPLPTFKLNFNYKFGGEPTATASNPGAPLMGAPSLGQPMTGTSI